MQNVDLDRRDMVVGAVYRRLMEIESRLLPCGTQPLLKLAGFARGSGTHPSTLERKRAASLQIMKSE